MFFATFSIGCLPTQPETKENNDKKESENNNVFPLSVYVRMRPLVGEEIKENHSSVEYAVKTAKKTKTQSLTLKNCSGKDMTRDKKYTSFKQIILPKQNNLYTFNKCIFPSIKNIFNGVSTCAFAYGHTGNYMFKCLYTILKT